MRRVLRPLSIVLICAGLLLLVDGALTLAWEEPVSSLHSRIQQGRLDDLDEGARIELRMPYGRFTYRVERTRIVAPNRDVGHAPRCVRSTRADRMPSALLGLTAHRRVRAARGLGSDLRVVTPWTAPATWPMLLME